ncbi:hypothetical protein GCM10025876_10160 [Demequina litorisediminis]|uniref:Uncharacterized protein n=1 Tax=Demequina litorisediminis TaxID=1849022 RepID=A0ABQ6IAD7_9MICO|nr:hypothetical protein GCM10025876_10160 [Demequina litorisediminis]
MAIARSVALRMRVSNVSSQARVVEDARTDRARLREDELARLRDPVQRLDDARLVSAVEAREAHVGLDAVVRQLHVPLAPHVGGASPEVLVTHDGQRPCDALVPDMVVRTKQGDQRSAECVQGAEVRARRLEADVRGSVHIVRKVAARVAEDHAVAMVLGGDNGHRRPLSCVAPEGSRRA